MCSCVSGEVFKGNVVLLILPIYTCRPCIVYGGRLRSHIVMTVLSFKKNPILYFIPIFILLFVSLCVYYINTS